MNSDNDFGGTAAPATVRANGKTAKAGTFVNVTIKVGGKSIQVGTFLEGAQLTKDLDVSLIEVVSANVRGYDPAAPKDKAADFLGGL